MSDSAKRIPWWKRWDAKSWALAALSGALIAWFLIWGPVGLAEIPADPKFCVRCHNMELEYNSWRVSKHNSQICGDCHLPEAPIPRLFWDAIFGVRDMWEFNVVGHWQEPIKATPRTQRFLQENCIRCHGAKVHAAVSEDRYCWECHRELYHRQQLWREEQIMRRSDDPRD